MVNILIINSYYYSLKENINLKDTVKKFGKKFACGSSYNTEDLTIEL